MPMNPVTEDLPVALALRMKQEQVVGMNYLTPSRRVNAILELERVRGSFVRAENRAIRALALIDDDLRHCA